MITRFAPSPTGLLHLGHAFSALTAYERAQAAGGQFRLRIEDIDKPRCKPVFEAAIFDDLAWLGLTWEQPVLHQSTRMGAYRDALRGLAEAGLTYPCSCTRGDIRAALSAPQEGQTVFGPDGPVYPGTCRGRGMETARDGDAIRLDMARAVARLKDAPRFEETGPEMEGPHQLTKSLMLGEVGDIVLARRDIGTSYHLSVVVDDGFEGITEVVRGMDLFAATPIHVLLQKLLGLATPRYHHHRLIRDEAGKRLAKRDDARSIESYRNQGFTPESLRDLIGL